MLVRPITKEERLQSAQLFAIAFESPFDPNDLTPFAENPCIWAAFDEESGEMMSTVYVTDYRVQFDGGRYKMGGIGGVAGAALLGVIYAAATGGPMAEYALICAVGALISMVGDLAASAIKRNQGIKDYGKLIPGHGGILDRFDSVIFTAPAIYFLAKLVLGI